MEEDWWRVCVDAKERKKECGRGGTQQQPQQTQRPRVWEAPKRWLQRAVMCRRVRVRQTALCRNSSSLVASPSLIPQSFHLPDAPPLGPRVRSRSPISSYRPCVPVCHQGSDSHFNGPPRFVGNCPSLPSLLDSCSTGVPPPFVDGRTEHVRHPCLNTMDHRAKIEPGTSQGRVQAVHVALCLARVWRSARPDTQFIYYISSTSGTVHTNMPTISFGPCLPFVGSDRDGLCRARAASDLTESPCVSKPADQSPGPS